MDNKKTSSKITSILLTLLLFLLSILVILIIIVRISDIIKSAKETEEQVAEVQVTMMPVDEYKTVYFKVDKAVINDNKSMNVDTVIEEEEEQEIIVYREDVPLSEELQEVLYTVCEIENVDVNLVLGLIQCESNFNIDVKNIHSNCYGLMQLSPVYFPSNLTPAENIEHGVRYLADCIERYDGNVKAGLRAYNAGHDDGDRTYANVVISYAENWGYSLT